MANNNQAGQAAGVSGKDVVWVGEIAARRRRLDFTSLAYYLPDPDPVLRKQGQDISIYRDLTTDPHVWACIQSRKSGVLALKWRIDREGAGAREAKFIESWLKKTQLRRILYGILDAPNWGYQPLEIIWGVEDGMIVPVDVVQKPPEWFVFGNEKNDLRFLSAEDMLKGEELPPRKFLCPQHQPTYQNPYGERVLSRCFWSVVFKRAGLKFWAIMVEKYGMPWAIGRVPQNTQQEKIDLFTLNLSNLVQDGIAVLRDNQSVEFVEPKNSTASGILYRDLVRETNAEISKAVIGHSGGADSTPGRLGGEDSAMAVRQDIIDADKELVQETVNTLIRWVHEINFTGSAVPKFVMFREEQVDKTLAERDEILSRGAAKGFSFTMEYLKRAHGFEDGDLEPAQAAPVPVVSPFSSDTNPAAFAEGKPRPPATKTPFTLDFVDQAATNAALRSVLDLQKMVEQAMAAIEDAPDDVTPEEVTARLYAAYPKMNADAIVDAMTRTGFAANAVGRVSVPGTADAES